jgi:iron complex transport system substrate-binding protein
MGILSTRNQVRYLLLVIAIAILTFACSHNIPNAKIASKLSPGNCRVVKHGMGETCVPLNPQRIVALAPELNLDPLIALGIKPVGFTSYNAGEQGLFGASPDSVAGAKNVGNVYQPSIEKILMLKPDLILDADISPNYHLLSAIAPTVVVPIGDYDHAPANRASNKEVIRYTAQLLGQETRAEEVLSQYYQRIDKLKNLLGDQLQQSEVAVIFYGDGLIYTISDRATLAPVIFNDIGLQYKFLSRGGDLEPSLSIEALSEYDADILFIVNNAERPASFYFQHPLFSSLKAVKNNRAYIVDQETWSAQGMLGANKLLNDLFKYLPEGASNP